MRRPHEVFIGLRYVMSRRRNRFVSFISLASMLSIALGIVVLLTVLSVINGFERSLAEHLIGMEAHATVLEYGDFRGDWAAVQRQLRRRPGIRGVAPFTESGAMAALDDKVKGVVVRGILPGEEPRVSFLPRKMTRGNLAALAPGEFGVILGADLADLLGADLGERVTLVSPTARITPAGVIPRLKRFTVVGTYDTDMYEYDSAMVFTHMEDAVRFFRMDGPTGLRLRTTDALQAPRLSREALQEAPGRYGVIDWTQRHVNYFISVKMTKKIMFVILALIIAVAAFNVVSALVMMVTDKQADIAVLRTLGVSPGGVMRVFFIQGMALGLAGIALGVAGGTLLAGNIEAVIAALERYRGAQFLAPDMYFISELPAELYRGDVLAIVGITLLLVTAATVYPAWRAARVRPAEALRHE